jgi:uncharacterized membrane protein
MMSKKYWEDKDVAALVGKTLRTGVLVASITTIIGAVIYLYLHSKELPQFHTFTGAAPDLRNFSGILQRVVHLDGMGIIQLGVVVLIATPIIRVVLSAVGFLIEKDYLYVFITLLVLGIILFNMLAGLGG